MDFDPIGSYSRPDVLLVATPLFGNIVLTFSSSLTVNKRPGVNVVFNYE